MCCCPGRIVFLCGVGMFKIFSELFVGWFYWKYRLSPSGYSCCHSCDLHAGMQWWDTLVFHVGFLNGKNIVTDVGLHCCVLAATDVSLPTAVRLYVERCSQYMLSLRPYIVSNQRSAFRTNARKPSQVHLIELQHHFYAQTRSRFFQYGCS